jgi:abhydrolase domain-containing protein 17
MPRSPLQKHLIGDLTWKRLGRSILFIYTFFALYVYFRADSMIFLPLPPSYSDSKEILKIPVTPTETISAIYLPKAQATHTLLYIHGNAEDLGTVRSSLDRFQSWGFNVFAYDYRGYGTSNGTPSETHVYQDAEAAYNYLTQQLKIPANQIILYGRSIGGGSATELATKHPIAGLILESTFTSAFRVVVSFPILPFEKFNNLAKLRKIHCPILVMHGQADSVIPFHHGQTLFNAAQEPKQSLWIPDADHNDFMDVAGDRHRQALLQFQTRLNPITSTAY